jgi:hypothetical protein
MAERSSLDSQISTEFLYHGTFRIVGHAVLHRFSYSKNYVGPQIQRIVHVSGSVDLREIVQSPEHAITRFRGTT